MNSKSLQGSHNSKSQIGMTALTVNLKSIIELTFKRTATGKLVIMSPAGGDTGNRNGRIIQQLFNWTDTNDIGIAFDSATGFKV